MFPSFTPRTDRRVLFFPVINQMDTSGTTLGPRSASAPKPENFSKDELSAILKFVFLSNRFFDGELD